MATKGSKVHKVTRTVVLGKTFDDDGAPVEVVVRRLRPTTLSIIYKGIPSIVDEQATAEAREAVKALSQDEQVAEVERYIELADAIVCAAAVEPRFYSGEMPVGGYPDLWADVEALHEDDRVLLVETVLEMAGLVAKDEGVKEDAAAVASFPDADAAGRGNGG